MKDPRAKTAEELEREGHEFISQGHARLAEAARRRSVTAGGAAGEWKRVDSLPVPKRVGLAACRSGSLRAVKKGRVWVCRQSDADEWLGRPSDAAIPASHLDDEVRASLNLVRRRTA